MKKIKLLSLLMLTITMLTSCSNEVDLTYNFSCNEDLLDYVIPEITYENGSGSSSIIVTRDLLNKEGNPLFLKAHFNYIGFETKCSVRFRRNDKKIDNTRTYKPTCDLYFKEGKAISNGKTINKTQNTHIIITNSTYSPSKFEEYLKELCSKETKVIVQVSDDGDIKYETVTSDLSTNDDGGKEDNGNGSSSLNKDISLTYRLFCSGDLAAFVTPKLTYTDNEGKHEIILQEKDWDITRLAYCHKDKEDGTQETTILHLDENGKAPAPWVIDMISEDYYFKQAVELDRSIKENECTVSFEQKQNINIIPDKEYDLSCSFGCINGSLHFFADGVLHNTIYSSISININIGGKTTWKGNEVHEYLQELCSKPRNVIMEISDDWKISERKQ